LLTIEGDQVIQREPFDAAFPVLHGPMGEDGTVQGLFELASVPYVGCGVAASAATMDKVLLKHVLAQSGIPIAPQQVLSRSEYERDAGSCIDRCTNLPFPVYVKPANMGSSLGISKVDSPDALARAIDKALQYDDKIVIEQGLIDSREIEVSVLGNEDAIASVPGEICVEHADGFYSYDAKYIDVDGARLEIPANLGEDQRQAIKKIALDAYAALGCSGMGRVDLFLTSEGDIFVNEINAIPGFTAISMYPQLLAASGITASELVTQLIDLALRRHRRRAALKTRR
jgi:D-alanine-D-alanine ligase